MVFLQLTIKNTKMVNFVILAHQFKNWIDLRGSLVGDVQARSWLFIWLHGRDRNMPLSNKFATSDNIVYERTAQCAKPPPKSYSRVWHEAQDILELQLELKECYFVESSYSYCSWEYVLMGSWHSEPLPCSAHYVWYQIRGMINECHLITNQIYYVYPF